MAMFDKHKNTRQAPPKTEEPVVSKPASGVTSSQPAPAGKVAMIGDGIRVTGDITSNANLKVEGQIEGRAVASSQDVEVAESGVIKASITAKVVRIAGVVAGDISGGEKVIISKTGRVQGNIVAPRVQLEDGALFRGSIDMNPAEPAKAAKPAAEKKPAVETKPAAPSPSGNPAGSAKKDPGLTLKSG